MNKKVWIISIVSVAVFAAAAVSIGFYVASRINPEWYDIVPGTYDIDPNASSLKIDDAEYKNIHWQFSIEEISKETYDQGGTNYCRGKVTTNRALNQYYYTYRSITFHDLTADGLSISNFRIEEKDTSYPRPNPYEFFATMAIGETDYFSRMWIWDGGNTVCVQFFPVQASDHAESTSLAALQIHASLTMRRS